jgi:hypothetical protein
LNLINAVYSAIISGMVLAAKKLPQRNRQPLQFNLIVRLPDSLRINSPTHTGQTTVSKSSCWKLDTNLLNMLIKLQGLKNFLLFKELILFPLCF